MDGAGRLNAPQCAVTGESDGSVLARCISLRLQTTQGPLSGAGLQSPFRSPLFSTINMELQRQKRGAQLK